ncbi:MAG: UPF0182 family protein [Acidobacteria bacterium]|nr:MAG: UPF0182 family protein [Acidobacteriota bacterium]
MARRFSILVLAIIFLIFIFGSTAVEMYTDWLWFDHLGFRQVFTTVLLSKLGLGLGVGLISLVVLYANAALAISFTGEGGLMIPTGELQFTQFVISPQRLRRTAFWFSVIIAAFIGLLAIGKWLTVLQYIHRAPTDETDPLFHRSVSFYVFQLPLWEYLVSLGLALVILSLIGTAVIYVIKGGVSVSGRKLSLSRAAKIHLSLLGAALFLFLAVSARVDMFHLLYSPRGVVAGASYTDIHAELPLLRALFWVSLLGALAMVLNSLMARGRWALLAVAVYILVLVGEWIYPASIQRLVVEPNEMVKEAPYIRYNIAATRRAYDLDDTIERTLSGENTLTMRDIQANRATIDNIRLWDHEPLLDTFSQIQEIRTYYEFVSVDNDRYVIDGRFRQTMLSPRELSSELLPSRSWVNERLVFTHGYGVTLGPVNKVTPEGLPVLFIKDLPPVSSIDLEIRRPQIYFGELSNDYVFVRTRQREFDYPAGDNNVYTEYTGRGGIPIRSWFRRAVFALRFGSLDIWLSDRITPESRVLYYRNIHQRVRRIAPFLRYDRDPYMVISEDGRLFWIYDAYTTTNRYPYAQPLRGIGNYIRNAVKVVIDAYDGSVEFYLADPSDIIIQTYARIFPGLFRPLDEMPADLRAHLRYPVDLFKIQAQVYATYHMQNPQVFYNKEDQWEIPIYAVGGKERRMEPYYTIMKLPGEQREEFILMLPFTPQKKDNLAAWMVARSDGQHYGERMVYVFPKQKLIFGPRQISARINQDAEISRQISLWDQRGSQVIQGTLLVIPIEESLIYVQPLYLRAETGKIPELKRVIVAYQNQIAMEETLDKALARIFGEAPAVERPLVQARPVPPPTGASLEELAAQAEQHYRRALEAQRAGDWARYGEEIKRLGDIIKRMRRR